MDTKTCEHCKKEFKITNRELDQYKQVNLLIPDICVFCRWRQHFAFWPFGKFRKGVSALSGESLITILPENARYPIYTSKEWWSDKWDATKYGQDYDSTKPFFDQLKELQGKVPRPHQQGTNSVNSEWSDDAWDSKNCYLSRSVANAENIMYGYRAIGAKNSIDVSHVYTLDKCYACTYCFNSYDLIFSFNCHDCLSSTFLFDCRNCSDCFMSFNLRGKKFNIRNKQYTKEEYEEEMKNVDLGSNENLENLKTEYKRMLKENAVHKEHFNSKTSNSVGCFMANCNNCINVFSWEDSENCTNCLRGLKSKDCIDLTGNWIMELSGNNSCCTNGYDVRYSIWCDNIRYSEYLDQCLECEYCFGSVGLKKKKYYILNKQYTKEEYEKLRQKIISDMKLNGEYGKFPPYSMGLCDFTLSTGMIYASDTTRELIESQGGIWDSHTEVIVEGKSASELPDHIKNTDDSVIKTALICPVTSWRFNIAEEELRFLRNKNIALPRVHFDVRTKERMKSLSVTSSNPGTCCFCKKNINAYYPLEWGYKNIACEECYIKNIN